MIYMKKTYLLIVSFLCYFSIIAQNVRPFPYELPLTGTSKPDDIVESFGKNAPKGKDRYTDKGIVLTKNAGDFSGFAVDKMEFTSNYGLSVEFDYSFKSNGAPAKGDGLSFFIYDAKESFEIGSHGSSLGYSYRETDANNTKERGPGLKGAYLGVGLDVYQDFKNGLRLSNERREGITPKNWTDAGKPGGMFAYGGDDHVTLRGGMMDGDRYKGYPVLITKSFGEPIKSTAISMATLNSKGGYDFGFHSNNKDFDINSSSFQRIIVDLIPISNGMKVTVKGKSGNKTVTLIDAYEYKNSFKTYDMNDKLYDFKTKTPKKFKVGFAAAGGQFYQITRVKDVKISLPYFPETNETKDEFCVSAKGNNNGIQAIVKPFENDVFYTGSVSNPKAGNSSSHIKYSSFQFENKKGKKLGGTSYDQPDVGKWTFSATTGEVTLTVTNPNLKVGSISQVYYSVTGVTSSGGPFGDENYRCEPTPITLEAISCGAYTNPQLRGRDQKL